MKSLLSALVLAALLGAPIVSALAEDAPAATPKKVAHHHAHHAHHKAKPKAS